MPPPTPTGPQLGHLRQLPAPCLLIQDRVQDIQSYIIQVLTQVVVGTSGVLGLAVPPPTPTGPQLGHLRQLPAPCLLIQDRVQDIQSYIIQVLTQVVVGTSGVLHCVYWCWFRPPRIVLALYVFIYFRIRDVCGL